MISPFHGHDMGLLIPLFWTFRDVCPGFQSPGGLFACVLSCLPPTPCPFPIRYYSSILRTGAVVGNSLVMLL